MKSVYTKGIEAKLIRVKHEITLWDGLSAGSIIDAFKNIPFSCKLEISESDNNVVLIFTEEKSE
jgi:hypothetical protein